MDYSSTAVVEHTIFSIFKEIQMIKKIRQKKKNSKQLYYAGTHRHQYLAYESQQW